MTMFTNPYVPWALSIFFATVIGVCSILLHLLKRERLEWQQMAFAALRESAAHDALSDACLKIASEAWTEHEGVS